MSKINVDTWEPESGTAATMMASGDTVTVPSGASLVVASGATINITGATQTGFPTGGLLGLVVYTGNGTYTVGATDNGTSTDQGHADTTKIIIECQAAGGAGASRGGTGSVYQGGSGGGGAYSKTFRNVAKDDEITIVVPAGPAGGSPGSAGGAASLTRVSGSAFATITCDGGAAGGSPAGTTQGSGAAGAAVPTTGDINIGGGNGPGGGEGQGARSGMSFMGVGQAFLTGATSSGPTPVGYGIGGICGPTVSPGTGGAGGAGLILIWEYA